MVIFLLSLAISTFQTFKYKVTIIIAIADDHLDVLVVTKTWHEDWLYIAQRTV